MPRYFKQLLAFITLYLTSVFVVGGEIDTPSTTALSEYIAKNCRQECVDPDLLLFGVETISSELGIDPLTMLAIVKVESNFKPKAINKKNGRSVGLMQIQVRWHKDKFHGKKQADILDNLRVGGIVYRDCANKHKGSREKALLCYNGYQKSGMKTYVAKVMKAYRELATMNIEMS